MNHPAIRSYAMIAAIGLASVAAFGVDPPDLRVNALSGLIETVDATWSGSNYNVRYTVVNGAGLQSTSLLVSTNGADDVDPRITISTGGDAYVAWWRDVATDVVIYRKRSYVSGAWGAERTVGVATESNSRPRMAYDGNRPWVAYQIKNTKTRCVGAQIIDDDPEPFRSIVATTSYAGDLDVQLHAESGHLWVTWIDTGSRVGYSEYAYGTRLWAIPAYESFAADSVAAARTRIRDRVLNY